MPVVYVGSKLALHKEVAKQLNLTEQSVITNEDQYWHILNTNAAYMQTLCKSMLDKEK